MASWIDYVEMCLDLILSGGGAIEWAEVEKSRKEDGGDLLRG